MAEYLAPGVYTEEISVGPKPIEGVSTSTAGILGVTERGPEYAKLITSWLQFQRWYGGYVEGSYMAYAVKGFFDNGGQRCFIARVTHGSGDNPTLRTSGALDAFTVEAVGKGEWGNNIRYKVEPAGSRKADEFKLILMYYRNMPSPLIDPTSRLPADLANRARREPDALEVFDNLSSQPGRSSYVVTVVNASSRLVRIQLTVPANANPPRIPNQTTPTAIGASGADGDAPALNDYTGTKRDVSQQSDAPFNHSTGLEALNDVDQVSLLLAPDENEVAGLGMELVNACEILRERFAVSSAPQGSSETMVPPNDSTRAAIYYPWIWVLNPVQNRRVLIPPTGHIAGIIARTDIERGVHKAPANEVVRGALDLEFPVTKGMQDILNPNGVNCIRDFRPDRRGIRLWGARTMTSDPEWKYVNVRRLFLYLEESIDEGTQWVVFEPNNEALWARVRRTIEIFLIRVWRSGALMGTKQEEAFFVKCDRTTMTQDDIDNGRLVCLIGLAPTKPAEFVIFRFFQKTIEQTDLNVAA